LEKLYSFLSGIGLIPAKGVSDQEVAYLAQAISRNYMKSKSLTASIKASLPKDTRYDVFLKLVNSVELGINPALNEFPDKKSETASTLSNILILGLRRRSNIAKNLENFSSNLLKKIALRNKIKARVNGMQVLSLLGLIFFFPLFSGISSALVTYSIGSPITRLYVSNGMRAICLAYIFEILLITRAFLKPAERFALLLSKTMPLLVCSYLMQFAAYCLASYAI